MYAPVLLLMPVVMVLSFGVLRLTGIPVPAPLIAVLPTLIMCVVFFIGAVGEELGWSGYAIDHDTVNYGVSNEAKEVIGLVFGQTDNLADVFQDIAYRRGLGVELAEGVRYLSRKYGGQEFAAYEPRSAVGQGLGYAVANRGACHLNAGYPILFEGLGLAMDPYTPKGKAAVSILFQNLMQKNVIAMKGFHPCVLGKD